MTEYQRQRERELPSNGTAILTVQRQIQELHQGLPHSCKGPRFGSSIWAILSCFSRSISRELDQKCCIWDLKQCKYGLLVPKVPTVGLLAKPILIF